MQKKQLTNMKIKEKIKTIETIDMKNLEEDCIKSTALLINKILFKSN